MARGLVAGVVGTAAMTAWQELSAKLQSSGEDGTQQAHPQDPWENASAPAQVAKRVSEVVFGREISSDLIPVLTNVMHWAYGTGWGAVYGLVTGSNGKRRPLRRGALFGAGVWMTSYAQLVPMGLYEPPWKYAPTELAMDLSYHLVYGAGVGLAFAAPKPP